MNEEESNIYFDLIFSFEEQDKEKIANEITNKVNEKYPNYHVNIIMDSDITD